MGTRHTAGLCEVILLGLCKGLARRDRARKPGEGKEKLRTARGKGVRPHAEEVCRRTRRGSEPMCGRTQPVCAAARESAGGCVRRHADQVCGRTRMLTARG